MKPTTPGTPLDYIDPRLQSLNEAMPTYEYACTSCHHEWEAEHSMKADPLRECPKCKQETAKRQISRGTGFILKGSGWYSDLYSGSSNKKDEEKKGDSKPDDGKPETKTVEGPPPPPVAPAAAATGSSGASADSKGSSGAATTTTTITSTPTKTTVTKTTDKT